MKSICILLTLLMCLSISQGIAQGNGREDLQSRLDMAYKYYKQGELSTTINQRKENFNAALEIYTELEKLYHPTAGNGALYFNIGNSYFQLGEYPQAIYYYYAALKLMPRNAEVQRNLTIAKGKLHLSGSTQIHPVFRYLFFFYHEFSLPERLQIFFAATLFLIVLIFIYIWYPKGWLKKGLFLIGFISIILFSSLMYTRYIEPLNGVLLKSTALYRDAGKQYAKVLDKPLSGGLKVQVLDTREGGKWLKIMTPDGNLGYVPMESIRLL